MGRIEIMHKTTEIKLEEFRARIIEAVINDDTELELSEEDNGKSLKRILAEHTAKVIANVPTAMQPEIDDIVINDQESSSNDEDTQTQTKEE